MIGEGWLTRKEAARWLTANGCPTTVSRLAWLAAGKNANDGPSYTRVGWRSVYYREEDLKTWADENAVRVERKQR